MDVQFWRGFAVAATLALVALYWAVIRYAATLPADERIDP